jgi:hypothetical protein
MAQIRCNLQKAVDKAHPSWTELAPSGKELLR